MNMSNDDNNRATESNASADSVKQVDRKARLNEIKAELKADNDNSVMPAPDPNPPAKQEGQELNEFIKNLVEKKKQRQHQLQIIQNFFENPLEFGINTDIIPTSTTREEILERKQELQYRIDLLKSLLAALEGEMQFLILAEQSDEKKQAEQDAEPKADEQ